MGAARSERRARADLLEVAGREGRVRVYSKSVLTDVSGGFRGAPYPAAGLRAQVDEPRWSRSVNSKTGRPSSGGGPDLMGVECQSEDPRTVPLLH